MTRKLLGIAAIALAASTILSVPAAAVTTLASDSFSTEKSAGKWVADRYPAEDFAVSDGRLYLSVGPKGSAKNRPADKQDSYYAIQGKKLPCERASSATWTATVKINLDDSWTNSVSTRRRAEFRVDLVDRNGKAVTPSPTIAIIKNGSSAPSLRYVNSESDSGWRSGDRFINGDNESETLYVESGWRTLLIKAKDGIVSYYLDEKKVGTCPLPTKAVYPAYMALGVQNNGAADTICFDSCTLYDGAYGVRPLTSSAIDKRNDRLSISYEKKRNNWEDSHTEYMFEKYSTEDYVILKSTKGSDVKIETGRWYKQSSLKSKLHINDKDFDVEGSLLGDAINGVSYETRETEEMPDSYWEY